MRGMVLVCAAGAAVCAGSAFGGGAPTTTAFVKTGDPVPGMAGFTFSGGGQAVPADDGSVLFVATISGAGSNAFNDHVLVIERADGTREVLAREADPVPGLAGYVYRGGSANTAVFNQPVLTGAGTIGVACEVLQGATVRDAVLTTAPVGPGLTVTAYETMAVAAELGESILVLDAPSVSIHDGGLVSFGGRVIDDVEGVAESVWYGSSLGIMTSLQTQLPAPGFGVGVDVIAFEEDELVSNAAGEVVFGAAVDGPGINNSNRNVLYSGDPTNLGVLARTGDPAPGAGGATFAGFDHDSLRMNAAGAVCFFAHLSTTSGPPGALMSYGDGGGFALVKDGDPVADLPGLTHDVVGGRAEMNAGAAIAFVTRLSGAPSGSDSALFIGDPVSVDLVVREGDVIDGHVVGDLGGSYFAINDRRDVVVLMSLDEELAFVAFPGDGGAPWVMARQTEALITDRGGFVLGLTVPWRINTLNGSNGVGRPMPLDNNGRFALNVVGSTGNWIVIFDLDGADAVCVADFTGDGTLDFFDLSAFLQELGMMTERSDLNDDGAWDFFDVSAFLMAYSEGCP